MIDDILQAIGNNIMAKDKEKLLQIKTNPDKTFFVENIKKEDGKYVAEINLSIPGEDMFRMDFLLVKSGNEWQCRSLKARYLDINQWVPVELFQMGVLFRLELEVTLSIQKEKQKQAFKELVRIREAIESYIAIHSVAPECDSYSKVREKLGPKWGRFLPTKDPYGFEYQYKRDSLATEKYLLGYSGEDGIFNGWEQSGKYVIDTPEDFKRDIILSGDDFIYSPATKKD
jgi:hypothetical protein